MKPKGFDPKRLKRSRACVLGLGKSGRAAANLLVHKGFRVFVSEASPRAKVSGLETLDPRVELEFGGHTRKALEADFVVKSPGLPPDLPILRSLRKAGMPIYSELEVALAFCPSKNIWAVSGTNGKTTTTALLGAILRAAGRTVHVCGNIGLPASQEAPRAKAGDDVVLEVSSYQLEDSVQFHPKVAALLNITPDHLEHHRTLTAYAAAKARLFSQQSARDVCVVNSGDALAVKASEVGAGRRLFFGEGLSDARIGERIAIRLGGRTHELRPPALLGRHNLENAAAAALMAASQGVPYSAIQTAFDAFGGVEHRLERAGAIDGIVCVNDSKATNVDSTRVALESFDGEGRRLLLILGGRDKRAPYKPLSALIRRTTRAVFTIGEAAPLIEKQLAGASTFVRCGTLKKAVSRALKRGRPGDILLLSPACASFDQFENFEERGRAFKALVREQGAR